MRIKVGRWWLAALAVAATAMAAMATAAQAASPDGFTTVDRSVVAGGPFDPAKPSFLTLQQGPGWARVVRELLPGQAQAGRDTRRRSLSYFAQLSDFQLADEESPSRVEFADSLASSAWRPMEAFGPHTVDAAIRQINRFTTASPVQQGGGTRATMDFALTTGDNADNQQFNENVWVRQLLEGGLALAPNSGVKSSYSSCSSISAAALRTREFFGQLPNEPIYTGVADFRDQSADTFSFYDPNQPQGQYADWPRYRGLLDRAQQTFTPVGLRRGATAVPSYLANGNHDGLVQGNQAAISSIEGISTGCFKPLVPEHRLQIDHQRADRRVRAARPGAPLRRQGAAEGGLRRRLAGGRARLRPRRLGAEHRLERHCLLLRLGSASPACASSQSTPSPRAA